METVALFTQAVYLMFSAVYVFKETVEHVLLSAGEGHHHHPGDEDVELYGYGLVSYYKNEPLFPPEFTCLGSTCPLSCQSLL